MPKRREVYPFWRPILIGGPTGGARRANLQPILPIRIWGPDGKKTIGVDAALIDTGADYCTYPSRLTNPIGHRIRSGRAIEFQGAASTGKAWEHFVDISILTRDFRNDFCKISKVPVHLVQKHIHKYFPVLLGRNGFLDQFVVHIDFPNKLLVLEI